MRRLKYTMIERLTWKSVVASLSVLCFLISCNKEEKLQPSPDEDKNTLRFEMALPQSAVANAQVYFFNGTGTGRGQFNRRIMNINRSGNNLSMMAPAGTWDIGLLTFDDPAVAGKILQPVVGVDRNDQKMWETVPEGGFLPSVPELLTARVDGQVVDPDGSHTATTSFARNVAMVKFVIKDARGLSTTGDHYVYFSNVPSTLTWNGGLYPDKDNPAVSSSRMRGSFRISNDGGGFQQSDTVTFIVPAHRGSDFLLLNPTDTSTHKLNVSVDLLSDNGTHYVKENVELHIVPKANKILVVNLLIKGSLEFETTTHDWVDSNHSVNISHTSLLVSKTNVGLSYRDTVIVSTNAADFTVQNGAPWITTQKIDDQRVVVTADIMSYTVDRSSYIDIVANNVTKRINVTQRPDVGTITAFLNSMPVSSFWVSPTSGNTTRTITVNSTGPWQLIMPDTTNVTTPTTGGGAGSTNVVFTRKSQAIDNGDYSIYGNRNIKIRNTQSLEVITVTAQNLYMVFYNITVGNAPGINTTTVDARDAISMGGSGLYTITSKPSWLTSATINADGTLTLVASGDPTGEPNSGSITFTNSTDPTYTITTTISQDVVADFEPFAYFVVKFTWNSSSGNDVDIDVYFDGNYKVSAPAQRQPWDLKSVGYGKSSLSNCPGYIGLNGAGVQMATNKNTHVDMSQFIDKGLLFWGGDNTSGGGETIFFNAPMVDNDADVARFVKLVCKVWYYNASTTATKYPIRTSIYAYDGGTIIRDDASYNFFSSGGTFIYGARNGDVIDYNFTNEQSIGYWAISATITYDKLKHSAKIEWGQKTSGTTVPVPKNEQ